MASPAIKFAPAVCLLVAAQLASAQQAAPYGVNAYGIALAPNSSAIEQSRLYRDSAPRSRPAVDANGNALPVTPSAAPQDDSFGAQQFLKNQERPREFVMSCRTTTLATTCSR